MTLAFLKDINALISEATISASDEEMLADKDLTNSKMQEQLERIDEILNQFVNKSRESRLNTMKKLFSDSRQAELLLKKSTLRVKDKAAMLSEIVQAINDNYKVPEGILIAFREQGKGEGSEEDIKKIWEDLVDLGLIEHDKGDK